MYMYGKNIKMKNSLLAIFVKFGHTKGYLKKVKGYI